MDNGADSPWGGRELAVLSREELEELVRVRSAEVETVMDAMVDVLLKLDDEGRIEFANAAVESTLGYDPDAVVGRPIDALLASPAETEGGMLTAAEFGAVLFNSGQVPDVEVAFSTADGQVIPMSLSTSVLHTGDDAGDTESTPGSGTSEIEGFVCVAKNVSDRIERERLRERKNEQLELLNRLVSHDIRNDVDLILEVVRAMQRDSPPPEDQLVLDSDDRERLDSIAESGYRITDLTETAQNLTRSIAELDRQTEPVPLADTLEREIVNASTISAAATVEVNGDIPEVTVQANEMLGSVFRNLLTNAITHNDKDEPQVTVSVSAGDETVTVRIADNGPGLPAAKRDALDTGAVNLPEGGDDGFGLYIVSTLLRQYDGSLAVAENDPDGTVFEIGLERSDE